MYIIIGGGGKVGYYLARHLIDEGHEVLVIEKDKRKCDVITEELGSVCVRGDACEARVLEDAGTKRADLVIAVTGDDEDNLIICQVAKYLFGVNRTIARINNPKNESIFQKLGIDVSVSSTNVILEQIEHELPTHPLTHLLQLRGQGLEIVEVKVPVGSPAVGRKLADMRTPPDSLVAVVIRGSDAHVANGETTLQANDRLVAVTKPELEGSLRRALVGA